MAGNVGPEFSELNMNILVAGQIVFLIFFRTTRSRFIRKVPTSARLRTSRIYNIASAKVLYMAACIPCSQARLLVSEGMFASIPKSSLVTWQHRSHRCKCATPTTLKTGNSFFFRILNLLLKLFRAQFLYSRTQKHVHIFLLI